MKQNKKYFANNRLDKGYGKNNKSFDKHSNSGNIAASMDLPPINIIEEYEELSPGFTKKLLEMAAKEQENRFELEKKLIEYKKSISKFTRIIGVMISLLIIFGAILLSMNFDYQNAALLIVFGFGSIITGNVLTRNKSKHIQNKNYNYNKFNKNPRN